MSNPQAIRAVQRQAWFIVFAGIAISSTSHAQDLLRDEQVGRLLESNLALDGAKLRRPAFTELTLFPNWSQVALFRNTQPSYIRRGDLMPTIPGFANPKSGTESGPLVDVVADLVVHEYMADLDGDGKPEIVQEYHSSNIEWQDLLTFVGSVSSAGGDEQVLWSSALSWGGSYPVGFAVETLLRSITTTTGAIATLGISLGWEGPEFIDAITNGGPTERTLPIPLSLIFSGGHLLEAADVAIQPGLPFVFDVTISSSDDVLLDQHDVVVNDLLVAGALTGRSDLVVRGNLDVRGFYTNAGGTVKGDFTVFSGGRVSSLSGTVEGNLLNSGEIFNATGTVVGSLVQASGATLETGNLTVLGGFLANPGELIVRGSLNTNAGLFSNSGTMRILGGSFTNTDVVANGGQIEWESGTFRQDWINNATLNILDVTGSRYLDQTARLVNNATVNQAGLLSFDRTSADRDLVVNNSLWVLDGDSADVLYSGTSGTVDTGTFVNAGTLRKIGGGTSRIDVGFRDDGHLIDVLDGTLYMASTSASDGLSLTGTSIDISSAGVFDIRSTASLTDITIDVDEGGLFDFHAFGAWAGTITGSGGGTITNNSNTQSIAAGTTVTADFTDAGFEQRSTFDVEGDLSNIGDWHWHRGTLFGNEEGRFLNNATLNILDVTGSRYLDQTARLVNNATVNQAGLLSFDRTSADRDLVVNNSLWVLDGDSADVLYSGTSGTSGTVDTGTFVNAGTLRKIGGGRSDINVGFTNRNGTVDVFEGTLSVQQHDGLVNGTLVGGAWTVRDGGVLTLNGGSISTNAAHVTLHGPTAQFDGLDGLVVNTGSLTLLDGHEFDTAESLYNFGTIETRTRSRMYVHGDFILQASATTTIEFDHRMISNIDGVALIADGGSDRSSSAHLGGLSMAGSLSGLGDGTTFSPQGLRAAIEIDGFAQLSGTLDLRLEDLSLGNPGVEFTILSFAGYSGSFDEILFPLLGPGTAWWWEARTTSFVVGLETMAPLSVPTPAGFLLIGAGILLRSRRRHTPRQTAA